MDRDALGWLATLQGECEMVADRLDREALQLDREAAGKRAEAESLRQRGAWASEAYDALEAGDRRG